MNKTEKLEEKRRLYDEKIRKQIERNQSKCKHQYVDKWVDYHDGLCVQCKYCGKYKLIL